VDNSCLKKGIDIEGVVVEENGVESQNKEVMDMEVVRKKLGNSLGKLVEEAFDCYN
jgi:hypothetical protein